MSTFHTLLNTLASYCKSSVLIAIFLGITLAACSDRNETASDGQGQAVVDVQGRKVVIDGPKTRLAIDDSRYLIALALLHDDPGSLLSAWAHDANRLGNEGYAAFLEKSPNLEDLPRIASSAQEFDVESLIAARPDIAILSTESGLTQAQIARVEEAGIPVVMLDFFTSPMANLEKSLTILGEVTGRQEEAARFLAYRQQKIDLIRRRVADMPELDRKLVFMEAHAGGSPDCCNSPGSGNASEYLELVGGHNIGADAIAQSSGKLSLEYVLSRDPDIYIGTGGPHLAQRGGLELGAGYSQQAARQSLAKVVQRRGIAGLGAVREGQAFGFSHQLLNSPLDIVAIEAFALWLHPELFDDLDPAATLETINTDYLGIPFEGTYWVAL